MHRRKCITLGDKRSSWEVITQNQNVIKLGMPNQADADR